ncbi:phosphotransferase [Desulforhopalus sp. IMCC35007]|uniref:phosphotransferase n=1 Tax=Desulforhopalus sp. IMCC35007 TaxID=2569543 RepID=UPI0010AE1553|nr:phosphotransferase [Desulforhopalus sp. IMCC35007]TKB07408.1 hypothetical protein FCL48_16830 [Desulforhopalus sp. IMCC35007]
MLLTFLYDNWGKFFGQEIPRDISLLPLSSCKEEYGNNLVLIFVNKEEEPSFVLKISKNCNFNLKLEQEFASLSFLSNTNNIGGLIPIPFFSDVVNGKFFFIQKAIAGKSLWKIIKNTGFTSRTDTLIKKSIEALIHINLSVPDSNNLKGPPLLGKDYILKDNEVAQILINAGINNQDLSKLISSQEMVLQESNRKYFQHGDYWPTNIFCRKNNVAGVIDWEFASVKDYSTDIIWFVSNLAYCISQRHRANITLSEAIVSGLYCNDGPNHIFLKKYLDIYRVNFEYSKNTFECLFHLCFVEILLRNFLFNGSSEVSHDFLNLLRYALNNKSIICI